MGYRRADGASQCARSAGRRAAFTAGWRGVGMSSSRSGAGQDAAACGAARRLQALRHSEGGTGPMDGGKVAGVAPARALPGGLVEGPVLAGNGAALWHELAAGVRVGALRGGVGPVAPRPQRHHGHRHRRAALRQGTALSDGGLPALRRSAPAALRGPAARWRDARGLP